MHKLRRLGTVVGTLALSLVARQAWAVQSGERLAVIIVVDEDSSLSDDLTEVAIAKLAERRDGRLVGILELRGALADLLSADAIDGCIERRDCLTRIQAVAGADALLIGVVRRREGQFVVDLSLVGVRGAGYGARFSETVPANLGRLIAVIQAGVIALFEPKVAPAPADPSYQPPAPSLRPPSLRLAFDPAASPALLAEPPRKGGSARDVSRLAIYGYGAGGVAVVSLSAAVVMGALATGTPRGETRAQQQADLNQEVRDARVANGLLILAGAAALSACAALVWHWRSD
jgi:hypothetical protein